MPQSNADSQFRTDPQAADAVPLDPGMAAFNARLAEAMPAGASEWPLPRQREAWTEVCRAFRAPRPAGLEVADITVKGVHGALALRIYRPAGGGLRPGLLYFHGGGWILGGLDTHDDICAGIAAGAGVAVVAVDYRLAPEHPHPAQLADALVALSWLRRQGAAHGIDPGALLAAGDSAGGQMTAGLTLHLRDQRLPQLAGQILIYPVLGADTDTPSYRANALSPSLSRTDMRHYLEAFLGPPGSPARSDRRAVPLLEADLSGLPPAFVTAAGHNPLHDDAVGYAAKLAASGVPVVLRREPALAHSYMRARRSSRPAGEGFDAIVAAVRALAHRRPPA